MNKVFIGLILAVCILGMALVMLNNRLGRTPDTPYPRPAAETRTQTPAQIQIEADNRAREIAEAASRKEMADEQASSSKPIAKPPLNEPAPVIEDMPSYTPSNPIPERDSQTEILPPPAIAESVNPDAQKPEAQTVPARNEPALQQPAKPQNIPEKPKQGVEASKKETPRDTAPAASQDKSISRFVVYSREKGATIRIGGTGKMDFSHMVLENPDRVVVDLNGDWKFPAVPGIPKNDLVDAVRTGKNGSKARIVIDMKEKPRRVQLVPFKDGNGVDIRVDK